MFSPRDKKTQYSIVSLWCQSQVYNTMCRVFPRRFVVPLNVTNDTPVDQNLNTRPSSTATSVKISKDKVSCKRQALQYEIINLQSIFRGQNACSVIVVGEVFSSCT